MRPYHRSRCVTPRSARRADQAPLGVIGHLDAPRALVADQAHPRGERRAKRVFDGADLGRPPRRPAAPTSSGCAARPARCVRTDHECARISSRSRSCSAAPGRREAPGHVHREPACAQVRLDQVRQLDQPEAVRDRAPPRPTRSSQLLLRPSKLGRQALVGLRLLHRVQVSRSRFSTSASSRLSESKPRGRRTENSLDSQPASPAPAALPHDQLMPSPCAAYQRLQEPSVEANRSRSREALSSKSFLG